MLNKKSKNVIVQLSVATEVKFWRVVATTCYPSTIER